MWLRQSPEGPGADRDGKDFTPLNIVASGRDVVGGVGPGGREGREAWKVKPQLMECLNSFSVLAVLYCQSRLPYILITLSIGMCLL